MTGEVEKKKTSPETTPPPLPSKPPTPSPIATLIEQQGKQEKELELLNRRIAQLEVRRTEEEPGKVTAGKVFAVLLGLFVAWYIAYGAPANHSKTLQPVTFEQQTNDSTQQNSDDVRKLTADFDKRIKENTRNIEECRKEYRKASTRPAEYDSAKPTPSRPIKELGGSFFSTPDSAGAKTSSLDLLPRKPKKPIPR